MRSSAYPFSRVALVAGSMLLLMLLSACELNVPPTPIPVDGEVYEAIHWLDSDKAMTAAEKSQGFWPSFSFSDEKNIQ